MESKAGPVHARVLPDGSVAVDMGEPDFAPASIPLDAPVERLSYSIEVEGESVELGAVSIGNPHAVLRVEDVKSAPVARLGPPSSAIRAFHGGPTWASCKSSERGTSHCVCSSAAWAKLSPAARALARPWRWALARDCSRPDVRSSCRAEPHGFLGKVRASTRGSPDPRSRFSAA
jgi:hypothetical protein